METRTQPRILSLMAGLGVFLVPLGKPIGISAFGVRRLQVYFTYESPPTCTKYPPTLTLIERLYGIWVLGLVAVLFGRIGKDDDPIW